MLFDNVTITIKGGDGGNGAATFKRNAQTSRGGPDGGNGGNGGNVYFRGINDIEALSQFRYKKKLKAEEGVKGGKNNLYGRNGEDLFIYVPIGTRITDITNNTTYEVLSEKTNLLLAKGGRGGRGNNEFKTATNQAPQYAEPGEQGEEKQLRLELRIIADVGLIGLPNAGKSSLLKALTRAQPKIGDYPFTTLEPNLGVMEGSIVLADIPGLIEGASEGRGLGTEFLRHIEKTKVLAHCIDVTTENIEEIYTLVKNELSQHNTHLLEKQEMILLTKTDLVTEAVVEAQIKKARKLNENVIAISVIDEDSLTLLKEKLASLTQK